MNEICVNVSHNIYFKLWLSILQIKIVFIKKLKLYSILNQITRHSISQTTM